jgi:hypothetical protein
VTLNKRGSIKHTTIQRIRIKTPDGHFHEETAELYVTTLADHDIIFGTDWLRAHNPEVDWMLPQVSFTRCPKECTLSQTPLIITSRKAQTRATTINAIQPCTSEEDTSEPSYANEAITAFEETLSWSQVLHPCPGIYDHKYTNCDAKYGQIHCHHNP